LRDADGVVAVSNELAGRIAGFGIDKGKIRVIYDGVNPKLFSPGSKTEARVRLKLPPDGLQFLFVGNLVPVKGVDTLISACDLLNRGGLKFALHIVGKGRLGGRLEDQARACNLGDAIRFVGPVAQQDIPDWYRSADVLVLPSRSEGVPNVLLEASACDTPWVATNVGGNPEIAHLGNSRLVQPNSPNDLAIAMKEQAKVNPARPSPSVVRTRLETAMETIEFLDQVIASRRGAVLGEADVAGS
jgi:glycosyltransferase involved in cell wall biosynthesis